jgi:hypothetical protein
MIQIKETRWLAIFREVQMALRCIVIRRVALRFNLPGD